MRIMFSARQLEETNIQWIALFFLRPSPNLMLFVSLVQVFGDFWSAVKPTLLGTTVVSLLISLKLVTGCKLKAILAVL
jgi:hypothetical protein